MTGRIAYGLGVVVVAELRDGGRQTVWTADPAEARRLEAATIAKPERYRAVTLAAVYQRTEIKA